MNAGDRKHWDLYHSIVEVFYAVYNELGHGFLEAVYEEALALALMQAGPIRVHSRKFAAK